MLGALHPSLAQPNHFLNNLIVCMCACMLCVRACVWGGGGGGVKSKSYFLVVVTLLLANMTGTLWKYSYGFCSDFVSSLQWCCEPSVLDLKFSVEVENSRQPGLHPSGFHHLKSFLRVGCWNVHSLVEADGGFKTATVRTGKHPVAVDRKIKFLVNEVKTF